MVDKSFRLNWLAAAAPIVFFAASTVSAQDVAIPRHQHAWGRFLPDSWTQVKKLTEELDQSGVVQNTTTTETKTTLVEVSDTGYTLLIEVTAEVSGRQFTAKPKIVKLGYHGESNGETANLRRLGEEPVEIAGRKTMCTTIESVIHSDDRRIVSTMLYSDRVSPYILRRDTRTLDKDGKPIGGRSKTDVVALDMPYKVMADIKNADFVRIVRTHAKGSSYTMEVHCAEVPGGVVSHASKEMDENGRQVKRSTLELVDYGIAKPQSVGRLMSLREKIRRRRARKATYQLTP